MNKDKWKDIFGVTLVLMFFFGVVATILSVIGWLGEQYVIPWLTFNFGENFVMWLCAIGVAFVFCFVIAVVIVDADS